jgi:membrane fusion protein (multidrug efflux system)
MKTMYRISALALVLVMAACGSTTTSDKKNDLEKKKAALAELKKTQQATNDQIATLEKEIAKLDTSAGKAEKVKLVSLINIEPTRFAHYVDLKGSIDAENIAYVTPRGPGGQVKAIYVKQGDNVRQGQLLMKLDDAVTQQQLEGVKVQLSLAQTTYDRRKKLWDQNIGTEIELLQAKNTVDNLNKQIDLLKEQLDQANVYAGMSGVADEVKIKVGEFFSPASASMSGIKIVNTNNLKVITAVPENYLGRVGVGSNLLITLPELGTDTIRTKVTVVGKLIDPSTRSFTVEAKIPSGKKLRPNQLAIVRIQDYAVANAITIPVSSLQSDEKGKFVLVAVQEGSKLVARKKEVVIGELYGNNLEIKSGLQPGDKLITEGAQGLYDGQTVITSEK